jgi:phage terminase small subunit
LAQLTLKQKKFADEYIVSGNATESAIKAGYSKKTANRIGSENLSKLDIKNYIDERLKEIESEKIADQQEVLKYLSAVMRGEMTEQTLKSVGESGQVITEIDVGAKDRIKAAELLGKRYRLWTDKSEVEVTGAVVFSNESEIPD